MQTNWSEVLPQVTSFLKDEANTKTIIGEEFSLGEFSCVPVMRLGMGFGSGGGEGEGPKGTGKGDGGGAAGGIGLDPIGFLVSRKDTISFVSTHGKGAISSIIEKAPELFEKWLEKDKEESVEA
ncbi:MAG: GerW family sporulation protein [Bacteroidota bacterium]